MDHAVLTTIAGVSGLLATLGGVALTAQLTQRSENKRRLYENATRWHYKRRQSLSIDVVHVARKVEERILEAASFTDDAERTERLPGYKSVLLLPIGGLPGIIEEDAVEVISDAVRETLDSLDAMGRLIAEMQFVGQPEEITPADTLYGVALDAVGCLETFMETADVLGAVYALPDARRFFVTSSRVSLGKEFESPLT